MKRLLLIDDDKLLLRAMARALSCHLGKDWEILQTCDPQVAYHIATAEERVAENEVDVVLTDYEMPKYSGLDVLEEISKNSPATLRLLTSSHTIDEIVDMDDRAEFVVDFFIGKPVDPETIAHMLDGE